MTHGCDSDWCGDFATAGGFDGNIWGDHSRASGNWPDALSD